MPRRVWLCLFALSLAGCVIYPSVQRAGTVKIRPENGRILRAASPGDAAVMYVDVVNQGGASDTLLAVQTDVAARAELLNDGTRLDQLEIPPGTTVPLASETRHITLYELKRNLQVGESIIVTLLFKKSGAIGVITAVQ
jgi:copper(I)-binding protein